MLPDVTDQEIIEKCKGTNTLLIETPIIFTKDYRELVEPCGILKTIKDVGAFKAGEKGAETIPGITQYGRAGELPELAAFAIEFRSSGHYFLNCFYHFSV